jgi:fructokinase
MNSLFGIDLGGTKIEGVVLSKKNLLSPLARIRLDTGQEKGYQHIINQIGKLIEKLKKESGKIPHKIGIGTPGALDPFSNTIKNSNTTCLLGKPLKEDLEKQLGLQFEFANDANCFALAETKLGIVQKEAPEAKVVFGVIMGSGVGGGIVVNGKVINGKHGIAGEWGHNFLDTSGGKCYCGKTGCVETVISGKSLERFYQQEKGQFLKLKEIVRLHILEDDPIATKTVNRLLEMFGKAISNVINILDPDAIVLGGGVGNIDLLYTKGKEEIKKHLFNPYLHTKILKPSLGDSAGVFGAAMLIN